MVSVFHDIKFGIRGLVKNPGFTVVALVTLMLGIGASAAIFTVVNAVLLQSLPYADPGRLAWVSGTNAKNDIKEEGASVPDFIDWRSHNHSFEDMAALTGGWAQLTGGDEPESVMSGAVTDNFFSVLGVMPRLGRNLNPEDAAPGQSSVAIVSDGFWKSHLGGTPDAIGQTILIYDKPVTVIGVMPANFINVRPHDYKPMQIWEPMALASDNTQRRSDYLSVFGRLKAGVTLDQAHADLDEVAAGLEQLYPATNTGWRTRVESLHDRWVGDVRPALLLLTAAVGFLLLIACANIANLLLARTAARDREIAIRAALGAGRRRLVQQLLTESLLLAILGGALGVLLAWWAVRTLITLAPNLVPLGNTRIDGRVLCFALLASVVTGIVFGLLPALHVSGGSDARSLTEGSRTAGPGIGGRRTRDLLAAAEIALSLVLLIGSGLMINSFIRLAKTDPGFKTGNLLVMSILASPKKYHDGKQVDQFCNRLTSEIGQMPGCVGAAAITITPLVGDSDKESFTIEGRQLDPKEKTPDAEYEVCSPGYFEMMGIPLLAGRQFDQFDTPESKTVVVISQTMAALYWPNENPIGKRINLGGPVPWSTVVGIVGDTRSVGFNVPPYPQIYIPHAQAPARAFALLVRTVGDPMSMTQAIKTKIWSMDNRQDFFALTTMEKLADGLLAGPRFNMILMVIFAVIATVIASVGIYGVISYSVSQRTREIGIRMAIGASRATVLRLVVGQCAIVTVTGLGGGLVGALALTRLMSSLLYSVKPTDPATFGAVTVLLGLVSLAACYIPARRATRVDPMIALRYE